MRVEANMTETAGELYPIGVLARRAGVSTRTVRYYEQIGLLRSARRYAGGRRVFDEDALRRLRFIARLKTLGFSLEEISHLNEVFAMHRSTAEMLAALDEQLARHLDTVANRVRELEALRGDLLGYREHIRNPERGTAARWRKDGAAGMNDVKLSGYFPGAIGGVTALHGAYYHEHWGLGLYFESLVARELAEYLGRFDPVRDGFWMATVDGEIAGSITIDGGRAAEEGARLRWFVVSDAHRGQGIGRLLMEQAIGFCRRAGFARVFLWTFAGLDAARHLYEAYGFVLCEEHQDDEWGRPLTKQMFALELAGEPGEPGGEA
jgi:DNA-binding transcriptional MerR regulator/N-acetylglutamate synthase-like GNAT family acetyltransferase